MACVMVRSQLVVESRLGAQAWVEGCQDVPRQRTIRGTIRDDQIRVASLEVGDNGRCHLGIGYVSLRSRSEPQLVLSCTSYISSLLEVPQQALLSQLRDSCDESGSRIDAILQ